jgi:hypothetical protein
LRQIRLTSLELLLCQFLSDRGTREVRDLVNDLLIALGSERISFSHHLDDPFLHGDQGFYAFAVSDINTGSITTCAPLARTRKREVSYVMKLSRSFVECLAAGEFRRRAVKTLVVRMLSHLLKSAPVKSIRL